MINIGQDTEQYKEQLQEIEYVKSYVDDIYKNKVFYSFSLQTLELTRRFNLTYQKFRESSTPQVLHELLVATHNLELKLQREH